MRNLELPDKSPVHATEGMACTSQPLATQTAIDVLKAGGNALDAAVAACAVQCVVEPESTGIGGDCFCLYSKAGSAKTPGDIVAYNGSGRAPAAATVDWFAERGITEIETQSPHSVVVPGAVDAWDRLLADHGTKDLAELLQPEIRYARDGFLVASRVHSDFANLVTKLSGNANAACIFMPGGAVPRVGALLRQPALAATLERIARNGRDKMYTGETARDMVATLQALGGLHTAEDFATAKGEYVTPISGGFRDHLVHQCPPNGQGVIALLLLNVMSGIEVGDDPISPERMHAEIEAGRLTYAARDAWLADPAMAEVPVEQLLSADYAGAVCAAIDPTQAQEREAPLDLPRHESAVYITAVDRGRNACSFINTLFKGFGSGICTPSGVLLTNRAEGLSLDPASPNRIEGGVGGDAQPGAADSCRCRALDRRDGGDRGDPGLGRRHPGLPRRRGGDLSGAGPHPLRGGDPRDHGHGPHHRRGDSGLRAASEGRRLVAVHILRTLAPHRPLIRGSSASRRPSPMKLTLSTVSEIASPGHSTRTGVRVRKSLPS